MNTTPDTKGKQPLSPRAGRRRKWARFDLPVIRPGSSVARIARKLV